MRRRNRFSSLLQLHWLIHAAECRTHRGSEWARPQGSWRAPDRNQTAANVEGARQKRDGGERGCVRTGRQRAGAAAGAVRVSWPQEGRGRVPGTASLRKRGLLKGLWVRKGQPGREDGETPFPQSWGLRGSEGRRGEGRRGRQGHSSPARWGTIGESSLGGGSVTYLVTPAL